MSRLRKVLAAWVVLTLLISVVLTSCRASGITSLPAIPVATVTELGGVVRASLPISLYHSHFQYFYYDEHGGTKTDTKAVELFPVDVFVTYDAASLATHVFLARSPHEGCLLNWNPNTQTFDDPCFGSRFASNGRYMVGPSPRSLDELPAEIRDGMVWVRNEVTYGREHP